MKRAALLAASLGLTVNAHMIIQSPEPIAGSAIKSPLLASGSNFPCHGIQLPTSGGLSMSAGSSQLLSWNLDNGMNWAVHGGGSCQMSITYETEPDKVKDPKNWFVIYSIEGGCPSNTMGNLNVQGAHPCTDPATNGVDCVNQFNFTIPSGVKDGHAIMAWTWFNTVGNRELYMNCINTELSGGDGSEMDEFPTMFVGNMADIDSCPTTEGVDLLFPYPGKYVTTKLPSGKAATTASSYPKHTPVGSGCAGDGAPISDSGAAAAPASSAQPSSTSTQASASASGSGGAAVTVTTMETVTSGSASSTAAMSSAIPAPVASSAPPVPMASSSAAAPSGTASSGSCMEGKVSCPNPGAVVCVGNTHFGICNTDNCAVPQLLAAGTHCTGGTILKRSHVRHARRHVGDAPGRV